MQPAATPSAGEHSGAKPRTLEPRRAEAQGGEPTQAWPTAAIDNRPARPAACVRPGWRSGDASRAFEATPTCPALQDAMPHGIDLIFEFAIGGARAHITAAQRG